MPVYNPNIPLVSTEYFKKMGIKMLITNAYIIYNTPELREKANKGVHELINFDGVIMTDSVVYSMSNTWVGFSGQIIVSWIPFRLQVPSCWSSIFIRP